MSLHGVQSFMYRLKNDEGVQVGFKQRLPEVFASFDLTDEEVRALRDGDVSTLYKLGVHPLLLVPYSRFAGIPRPQYLAQLAPLRGSRPFKS